MNIEKLTSSLGLGTPIMEPVKVNGGLLHQMYHVTTKRGGYAVKILNPEIMKRADALRNFINSEKIAKALERTIPLVCAIEWKGKQIHCLDAEYYMIFPWLEASSVFEKNITAEHCKTIGRILGKMHQSRVQVEGVFPRNKPFELFNWDDSLQRIIKRGEEAQWAAEYQKAIRDLKDWNKEACDSSEYLAKIQVLSHRDLDPKNVIWKKDKAYVIDWESAGYINPFQEFIEVINYWCSDKTGNVEKEKFHKLMEEYCNYADIKGIHWSAVFCGSRTGMLGWLEYNVKGALGLEISSQSEIQIGKEQVIQTLQELYFYQRKINQIRIWLS